RWQRHILRARPPRRIPERIVLALKNISLAQGTSDLFRATKALVIPLALPGKVRVHGMVEVVAPHRVQSTAAVSWGSGVARIVFVGLGNHVDRAFQFAGQRLHPLLDL